MGIQFIPGEVLNKQGTDVRPKIPLKKPCSKNELIDCVIWEETTRENGNLRFIPIQSERTSFFLAIVH